MESDDPALQPVIVLRVVIRSPDLDTFVSKYSRFVKDDRIFIFTKSSQPPGTRVRFTLELADGAPLIHGEGTVMRIRADSGDPSKPPGMELKFVPLDDASDKLLARMLEARDSSGQFEAAQVTGQFQPPQTVQFKDETTDAQTRVRDANAPSSALREFTERPPTLPPLEKTGAHRAFDPVSPMSHDESGAVTIAQAPPSDRTDPNAPPSISLASLAAIPPPIPPTASIGGENKQSGGFATPTPLPAPIPASDDFAAAQRELNQSMPATRNERPGDRATAPAEIMPGVDSGPFAGAGPAPRFAESFLGPLPGAPKLPPPGSVPANPFSEVSDGAIEYFVAWSLEQSTAPKPKVAQAHFANVAMATPRAERRRSQRGTLLAGIAVGVFLGVPIGGVIVWYGKPPPAPVIVENMPEPSLAKVATADLGTLAEAPRADLAPKVSSVANKPVEPATKPIEPATKPVEAPTKPVEAAAPPSKPVKVKQVELTVSSRPPGASISVDGEAQGKTPATLSVAAGAHEVSLVHERYATVTQSIEAPGKLDITLKRPSATLHVESEPPGGDVIVEGKPRGKTPVDVTLDAFHHYDVQVMLLGTRPWHKKISLKPPQTNVTATLSVIREQ